MTHGEGKGVLKANRNKPGVYILDRDDKPSRVGETEKLLFKRLTSHALKPNARLCNFWN